MDNGKQIKATSFQSTHSQQVIGREAETATLLSRCFLHSAGLVAVSARVNAAVGRLSLVTDAAIEETLKLSIHQTIEVTNNEKI